MSSTVLRTRASTSTHAEVVTSPATITTPVLTRVSQATRPRASAARIASRTTSEIWSAILSGWPSETDSDKIARSEEHTSELQSRFDLVCRLLLEKKKNTEKIRYNNNL